MKAIAVSGVWQKSSVLTQMLTKMFIVFRFTLLMEKVSEVRFCHSH